MATLRRSWRFHAFHGGFILRKQCVMWLAGSVGPLHELTVHTHIERERRRRYHRQPSISQTDRFSTFLSGFQPSSMYHFHVGVQFSEEPWVFLNPGNRRLD